MGILCMALESDKRDIILDYMPTEKELLELSGFFSAFSDSTRLKILSALLVSELCVSDISQILRLNQTTTSHQLKFLKNCGVVESRREGKTIFYKIVSSYIDSVLVNGAEFLACL
ncbi:MAG: metalloregulator ArsR/SmtB family transcription factor [Firmicutes bacterium]|nr:metalloregulator ArsR/SmtB family transcription factor [Bacillota bacterium]